MVNLRVDEEPRVATYFGTSAEVWMNLQQAYDQKVTEQERGAATRKTVKQAGGVAKMRNQMSPSASSL